jgi:hypothetical protein
LSRVPRQSAPKAWETRLVKKIGGEKATVANDPTKDNQPLISATGFEGLDPPPPTREQSHPWRLTAPRLAPVGLDCYRPRSAAGAAS